MRFLLAVIAAAAVEVRKISSVTVLLPAPSGPRRAVYSLEAFGGHYFWSSTNPTLVEVVDQNEKEAKISPAAGVQGEVKAIILAQDKDSRQELRCEVYISRITRVEVMTTWRTISVEDTETLSVRAFDQHNNVFSSLEGLEFVWHIKDHTILQHIALRETGYKLSSLRRKLEEESKSTDVILVRGEGTGRTEIMVKHGEIASQYEVLTVSEHLILVPGFCYTLPQAEIQYGVKIMKGQESLKSIPIVALPAAHFAFVGEAIDVDSKLALGVTMPDPPSTATVIVEDSRIEGNTAQATAIVAEPHLMKLAVRRTHQVETIPVDMFEIGSLDALYGPASNWNFVQGHKYWLFLEVEDAQAHSLSLPRNLETDFFCTPDSCLLKVYSSPRHWAVPFAAQTIGHGILGFKELRLAAPGRELVRYDMETSIAYTVISALTLPTDVLVLANKHTFRIVASGGSRNYLWRSSDESVAVIGPDGVVLGMEFGVTNITVLDQANTENQATLLLYVRQWARNTFGEDVTTVSSKGVHAFPVYAVPVMKNNEKLPYFCNATEHAPTSAMSNPPWMTTLKLVIGPYGCAEVLLTPDACGELTLIAGEANQKVIIYDPLWLYFDYVWPLREPPLKLDHKEYTGFALALNSSVEVHLRDGPRGGNQKWKLQHKANIVRATPSAKGYFLTCLREGSMTLIAQVYTAGKDEVEAEAEAAFMCGIPTQVRVFAIDHVGRRPVRDLKQLSAVTEQEHHFALITFDVDGVPLAEPSDCLWSSSARSMENGRVGKLFVGEEMYGRDFQVRGVLREFVDSVTLTGAHQFAAYWPAMPMTHFIKGYDYAFCVKEGSIWELKWSLTGVEFKPEITDGAMRNATFENCRGEWSLLGTSDQEGPFAITLDDDGLLGAKEVNLTGTVYPLARLRHPVSQSHQEVGRAYDIPFILYDTKDNKIPHQIWPLNSIVREAPNLETNVVEDRVKTLGNRVGTFDLRSGIPTSDLWSNKVEIVIFPVFKLQPDLLVALPDRNLTAEFQIVGGTPDAVIRYRSSNETVVEVGTTGRVSFRQPGTAIITADLTVPDGVIATDTAEVLVAYATSAEIAAPPLLVIGQTHSLVTHLFTDNGERFTPALLAFPEEEKLFCDFAWRSEGFVFTPLDGPPSYGLVGKGLNAAVGRASIADNVAGSDEKVKLGESATVSVEIRCDDIGPLHANVKLKVVQSSTGCHLGVPLQSKVDLASLGVEQKADVTLYKRGVTVRLLGHLQVGIEEAEWLLVAKQEGALPTIVALAARNLEEVQFLPALNLLPLGSTASITLQFIAQGQAMAFPSSGIPVQLYSSHSSILKIVHFHDKARIQALKPGCAGIQVQAHHDETVFGVLRLCTALDALIPRAPVVTPGGEMYFFLEKASLGAKEFQIQLTDVTEQQIQAFFPKEMATLLDLSPSAVSIQAISMNVNSARVTFEVDPSSDRTLSSEEWSTQSVAERMWSSSARLGPFLRTHWDRKAGVFPMSSTRPSARCTPWTSSDSSVVMFPNPREGHAVAVGLGTATITYCGDFEQNTVVTVVGVHQVRGPAPDTLELTNIGDGAGDILVPLQLIEETSHEIVESAFVSQNLNVVCTLDNLMQHFFEISTQPASPDHSLACILRRLASPVSRLLSRAVLPQTGDIIVEVGPKQGDSRYSVSHTLTYPFFPAFVLLDNSGRELDLSTPLRLSKSRPLQSFRVWTGGVPPPVIKNSSDLRVVVEQSTDSLLSVQILLEGSGSTGASLLVEGSRGQVEVLLLEVIGSVVPTTSQDDAIVNKGDELLLPWWFVVIAVIMCCGTAYCWYGSKDHNVPCDARNVDYSPFRRVVRPDRY